ncbi:MAG: lactaldehyde reductase [Methylobacteriaceae bacterium]|jgi:lactaldehyde reductase|nr:lactaldehyde reductase [Methylobacteriaceae bacterium]
MAKRFVLNETSYHGPGAVNEIVGEVKGRGFKKALVVTDKGLVKAGIAKKVTDVLDGAGLVYEVYDNVQPNPTIGNVKGGVEAYKKAGADYIIAVGGGSPQDTAKAIGIIINNPEYADVKSLEGVAPTKHKSVPLIAVATTAGTAAEVTINYVITDDTDPKKRRKFVCVDPHDIPVVAIVDPDLMLTMPADLTAATGMDALTHAIESYVTPGAWELSDSLNTLAMELIGKSLRAAYKNDPAGKKDMALAQYVTGMAFSNVGLGVVHGMAHPLGAFYDTPHGIANAVLLPYVLKFNADYTGEKYRGIAKALGVKGVDDMSLADARKAAIDAVFQLSKDVGIPAHLKDLGVRKEDLPALAEAAMADVCTPGNPRKCEYDLVLALYEEAFGA